MYSIRKTNSKTKLSNYVNGVSQEKFILLISFLFIGISVFITTPFLANYHKQAVARDKSRQQKSLPMAYTTSMPIHTRRVSLDSNGYYNIHTL